MNRGKWAVGAAAVVGLGITAAWTLSGGVNRPLSSTSSPAPTSVDEGRVVSTPLPPSTGTNAIAIASAKIKAAGGSASRELFAYSSREAPHKDGPYTLYPIDIDVDRARAAVASGHLSLTAPDGSPIDLDYDRNVAHEDGNYTWVGRQSGGDAAQDAVLTFGPDGAFGVLPSANGQRLRITTVNGRTYMASAPLNQLKPGIRDGGDTVVNAAGAGPAPTSTAAQGVDANGVAPVDLVIGYTSGYRAYRGSASVVNTALTNLVDVANRALANSQITKNDFRLVGTVEVDYPDNTDNGAALVDLASRSSSSPLASLRTARAQYGADLVSLMRRFSSGQNGCGLAYIPQAPYASNAPDQTFSVVGDGTIDLGNGYYSYCPDVSLAHEMGHNLGAQHNKQTNATGGLYSDSYGYRNDTAQYYDVMSYGQSGQEPELLYSTPLVTTCKGLPCGVTGDADVTRTLRETLNAASSFRPIVVPLANASASTH